MLKNSDFPHEDQCLKEKLRNVIFDLEKGNKEKIISKSVWCLNRRDDAGKYLPVSVSSSKSFPLVFFIVIFKILISKLLFVA